MYKNFKMNLFCILIYFLQFQSTVTNNTIEDPYPESMKPTTIFNFPSGLISIKKKFKSNQILSVRIQGFNLNGKHWKLQNEEELLQKGITPLNLNENKSVNFIPFNKPLKRRRDLQFKGLYDFRFKIEILEQELTVPFIFVLDSTYKVVNTSKQKQLICTFKNDNA